MKAEKIKSEKIKKKEGSHVTVSKVAHCSFKAPATLIVAANQKYFLKHQKVSLSALVNELLFEYVSEK